MDRRNMVQSEQAASTTSAYNSEHNREHRESITSNTDTTPIHNTAGPGRRRDNTTGKQRATIQTYNEETSTNDHGST